MSSASLDTEDMWFGEILSKLLTNTCMACFITFLDTENSLVKQSYLYIDH